MEEGSLKQIDAIDGGIRSRRQVQMTDTFVELTCLPRRRIGANSPGMSAALGPVWSSIPFLKPSHCWWRLIHPREDLPVTPSNSWMVLFSSVDVAGRERTKSASCFKWSSSFCFSSNKLIYFSFSDVCRELSDVSIPSLNACKELQRSEASNKGKHKSCVNRREERKTFDCDDRRSFDGSSIGSVSSRGDGTFSSVAS